MSRARTCLTLFASLLAGTARSAAPRDHFTYSLGAGAEYSDNRLGTQTPAVSDVWLSPRAEFSLLHTGQRLQMRGEGQLHSERSLRGVADDRLQARLALSADWAILPKRLYWTFQDIANVQAIDPLAPDTPNNRQQTNVFLSGPVLDLGNPQTLLGRVEGRFADARAEETPAFDHRRSTLALSLQRQSDPIRRFALGAQSSRVAFAEGGDLNDFRRQDLFVQYDHELPWIGLTGIVGATRVRRAAGDSLSRALLRAKLRFSYGGNDGFELEAIDELSDAGRELAFAIDADERLQQETRRALVGPDVHRLRSVAFEWHHRGRRSEFSVSPFARDYAYLQASPGLERRSRGLRVTASLAMSPLLGLHAHAGSAWFDFAAPERHDRDSYLSVFLERQLSPRWSLRTGVSRFVRHSDLCGAGYGSNGLSLYIVYAGGR